MMSSSVFYGLGAILFKNYVQLLGTTCRLHLLFPSPVSFYHQLAVAGVSSQGLLGWGQTIEAVNRRKVTALQP